MRIRRLLFSLCSAVVAFSSVAAQQERIVSPFGEMYPAGSGRFSRDEERAIAVASAKLSGGSQKRLDAFFKVTRKGKDLWVFVFTTGGRPKWGQEGILKPALYTVVVSPQWDRYSRHAGVAAMRSNPYEGCQGVSLDKIGFCYMGMVGG